MAVTKNPAHRPPETGVTREHRVPVKMDPDELADLDECVGLLKASGRSAAVRMLVARFLRSRSKK